MNPSESQRTPRLGQLLPDTWGLRDALHVAVIPVRAATTLHPGQHIGLDDNLDATDTPRICIGVVDPFLPPGRSVAAGECFLLLLYPGSVTSLRHEWEHPAFSSSVVVSEAERAESEQWLNDFIGEHYSDDTYTERVPKYREEIAKLLRGDTCVLYGREQRSVPDEFWHHLERFLGRAIPSQVRSGAYFDCRC